MRGIVFDMGKSQQRILQYFIRGCMSCLYFHNRNLDIHVLEIGSLSYRFIKNTNQPLRQLS